MYQVDKETVHEISCDSLQELNEYLVNLDFDTMIAHAEERYQAGLEDTFDDIDPEQIRENLAQRGIINGEVVDPDALESDPIIQQVVADAEAAQEPAAPIHPQPKPKREQITFEPLYPEDVMHIIAVEKPVGVVVAALAWNFPMHNLATKLGPILASGCTAVIKPATKTPLSTLYFGEILHRIGFPKGVINFVAGDAREIGTTLCESPIPAMITMIGSTAAWAARSAPRMV